MDISSANIVGKPRQEKKQIKKLTELPEKSRETIFYLLFSQTKSGDEGK